MHGGIIVLGGDGMLGHKMFQVLGQRFPDTWCTIRGAVNDEFHKRTSLFQGGHVIERVDAMDFGRLSETLRREEPKILVNCIGIIKQRPDADAAIPSITLNALLPHKLAEMCVEWGGRVIHFGTDCVFSGKKGNYTEEDPSDAQDLYGKTKFLGEVVTGAALTLRTSIIGRELVNFQSLLEWFLSQNHKTVKGFTRAYYSGVTTNHMAEVVGDIIEKHPDLYGLYHVASETITKYDLLCLLREAYRLDVEIVPDEEFLCDRSMKGDKFSQAAGHVCPSWPDLVSELVSDPTPYEEWR